MRKYESVIIFNPELAEERVQENLKRIESLSKNFEISEWIVDRWGRREMSAKIGKHKVGNYVILKFKAGKHSIVQELTSNYRIMDDVLKYQTHLIREKIRKFKGNPKARPIEDDDIDVNDYYA